LFASTVDRQVIINAIATILQLLVLAVIKELDTSAGVVPVRVTAAATVIRMRSITLLQKTRLTTTLWREASV